MKELVLFCWLACMRLFFGFLCLCVLLTGFCGDNLMVMSAVHVLCAAWIYYYICVCVDNFSRARIVLMQTCVSILFGQTANKNKGF